MRAIPETLTDPIVYGLSRVNLRDLDRVLDGVAPAPRAGATIYLPCSDELLAAAGSTRDRGLSDLVRAFRHARGHVDHVVFAAQDATRAERSFLTDLFDAAIEFGVTTISISDTVSHALPTEFADLCAALRRTPRGADVSWSVHCHNELGLAVANTLAGVASGATQVEGTINGIGEGAGNTAIVHVANAVVKRPDAFGGLHVSLRHEQLGKTAALVSSIAGR